VTIDKFTKWIEVKPVTYPKADGVLGFLDELVHHYGLPHRIITDLGSNFDNHQFWEYCENRGIDVRYVSVTHLHANGKLSTPTGWYSTPSRSDYTIHPTPKEASGSRNYQTHSGGLRTHPTKPTGQSPYYLVYGSETIPPAHVMWESPAVEQYDEGISEDSRRDHIDGLEEARFAALVQLVRYLEGIRRYHDRNAMECPSMLAT
jgi:hypothetical protein